MQGRKHKRLGIEQMVEWNEHVNRMDDQNHRKRVTLSK